MHRSRSADLPSFLHYMALPQYEYGIRVPRDVEEALRLDEENGGSYWKDTTKLGIDTLLKLERFELTKKDILRVKAGNSPSSISYMMSNKI